MTQEEINNAFTTGSTADMSNAIRFVQIQLIEDLYSEACLQDAQYLNLLSLQIQNSTKPLLHLKETLSETLCEIDAAKLENLFATYFVAQITMPL